MKNIYNVIGIRVNINKKIVIFLQKMKIYNFYQKIDNKYIIR